MSSTEKEKGEPPADSRDRPMQLACVFCERIRKGEDTDCGRGVVMFEPLNPVTPGHMLFVPAVHVVHAAEQPWVTGAVFEAASAWGDMAARDFNLIASAGPLATQTVQHLHVHYVPRREGDGLHLPWTGQDRKSAATPSSSVRFGVGL